MAKFGKMGEVTLQSSIQNHDEVVYLKEHKMLTYFSKLIFLRVIRKDHTSMSQASRCCKKEITKNKRVLIN